MIGQRCGNSAAPDAGQVGEGGGEVANDAMAGSPLRWLDRSRAASSMARPELDRRP